MQSWPWLGRVGQPLAATAAALGVVCVLDASCNPQLVPVGGGCILNSDCDPPLICASQICRGQCQDSQQCSAGELCVHFAEGNACLSAQSDSCSGGTCPAGLVCSTTETCGSPCDGGPASCLAGQSCDPNGACTPTPSDAGTD